jgi:hypothetical protein
MKLTAKRIEKLDDLLHRDHVCGCGQSACDITAAYEDGQLLWSAHLLLSAGAASPELEELYKKINPSKKDLDKECDAFIANVPYTKCSHCESVNWNTDPSENEALCWQCAKAYNPSEKGKV